MKRRPAHAKIIEVPLETLTEVLHSITNRCRSLSYWLHVADGQRRLAGRGYDGLVAQVEGQLEVVREWEHVLDIQAEEDRGGQSTLTTPVRMPGPDDVAV